MTLRPITATIPADRFSVNIASVLLLFIIHVDSRGRFRCCSKFTRMVFLVRGAFPGVLETILISVGGQR